MSYQRILTIQDISCVGQCSMTVALPILSACGLETAILPSAVLSTHTGGFSGFTVRNLAPDMPAIEAHWKKEGLKFDAIYTGYLGSPEQIDYVKSIANTCTADGAKVIVDPAMADNGKLYYGFDEVYVSAMKRLCDGADAVLPNVTEACMLTGHPYKETYDEAYINELVEKLLLLGAKRVVLTGVSYDPAYTGVLVRDECGTQYYRHAKIPKSFHGTGDIYASAMVGAWMRGNSLFESAKIAADYTVRCIEKTIDDPTHWYGVKFELAIPYLVERLGENE
ncbi:MAG: pyridoxamine kinase [Clostridia bacterium]|nr:pyridoxamine kinase [Clostridia bacterium]